MRLTAEQRANIVRAAKEWLGTPYHHHGRVKKAGADCAMFPLSVYQECGILPADYQPPEYSVQWHLHRAEELYLKEIDKFVSEIAGPPAPADFVVFRFGRTYSHGAIVIDWPVIIHAYIPHGVLLSHALRDGELLGRHHKFFELAVGMQQLSFSGQDNSYAEQSMIATGNSGAGKSKWRFGAK